jgi:hypothetical protein
MANVRYQDIRFATPPVDLEIKTSPAADGSEVQHVNVDTLAAGDNNIGNVDVLTLPAIPAGTNQIGFVKVDIGSAAQIQMQADGLTRALVVMEYEHHELHDGSMFRAGEEVGLANNATRDILIVTPNSAKEAHLQYSISNTLEVEFEFYEDPTTTAAGTSVPSYNRNRNSLTAATTVFTHTPTVTATGTLLATRREGIGKTAGGSARSISEWILKRNSKYLLRLTSRGGAGTTNYVNWWCVWYEHTNPAG